MRTTTDFQDHRPALSARRRFQQWAFDRLYASGRWLYDPLTRLLFGPEWERWRAIVLDEIEEGPVLDLGCGTGALLESLASRGHWAVGVDASPAMLAAAERRRRETGPFGLVRADARLLPIADGALGAVVATFPAPFILDPQVTGEIVRTLRPGGIVTIVIGGAIDRWERWRWPIREALSLFYGRSNRAEHPKGDLLTHPLLDGTWREVPTPRGRAFMWTARRR